MNRKILTSLVIMGLLVISMFGFAVAQIGSGGGEGGVSSRIVTGVSRISKGANVTIEISPKIKNVDVGEWASYKVIIKDLHKPSCPKNVGNDSDMAVCLGNRVYQYKVEVDGDVKAEYNKEVSISAGSKAEMEISVSSDEKGRKEFSVKVEEKDNEENFAKVKAFLLVGKNKSDVIGVVPIGGGPTTPKPIKFSVFRGQGFIESKDEKLAFPLNINVRKYEVLQLKKEVAKLGIASEEEAEEKVKSELDIKEDIKEYWIGRLVVKKIRGARVFKLVGIERNNKIRFLVIPLKEIGIPEPAANVDKDVAVNEKIAGENEEKIDENAVDEVETDTGKVTLKYPKIGKLMVEIKKYPAIDIWEGEGSLAREWRFVAYGKTMTAETTRKARARIKEAVNLGNFTIQPVKIVRKRFLWIFPTRKKLAIYKVVRDGKVEEVKAEIGKKLRIGKTAIATKESEEGGVELEVENNEDTDKG